MNTTYRCVWINKVWFIILRLDVMLLEISFFHTQWQKLVITTLNWFDWSYTVKALNTRHLWTAELVCCSEIKHCGLETCLLNRGVHWQWRFYFKIGKIFLNLPSCENLSNIWKRIQYQMREILKYEFSLQQQFFKFYMKFANIINLWPKHRTAE